MTCAGIAGNRRDYFSSPPIDESATDISRHLLEWDYTEDEGVPLSSFVTREVGDLRLIDCHMSPSIGHRRGIEIARDTEAYFCLVFHRHGREVWHTAAGEMPIEQGCVAAWHTARPLSFRVMHPLHKLVIVLPETRVSGYLKDPESYAGMIVSNSVGIGSMLNDYIGSFYDHFSDMTEPEITTALGTAVELFGAFVESTRSNKPALPRTSLIERITAFIERRLDDPDLTPTMIAESQGISLRYLHLLFSQRGETVGGWIRKRRLIQSGADLARSTGRDSVTEISYRWGFKDPAHFSRAFKTHFGVSPREFRG